MITSHSTLLMLSLRKYFLVFLLSLGFIALGSAQTTLQYVGQSSGIGARAEGLGGAHVADPYDVSAMYWNPGALVHLLDPSVVVNHAQDLTNNLMLDNLATPLISSRIDMIAIGITVNHRGYLEKDNLYDFRIMQFGYDIAYARELMPTFSVGGRVGVQYGYSGSSQLWAASSSFGIFYSPSQEINYGAAINGLGSGIQYSYSNSTATTSSINLPRSLQVGATMRFPAELKESVILVAIANEKVFGKDGLRYKGGAEIFPVKYLTLRIGYITEPGFGAAHYGLGFHIGRFHLDYGLSPSLQSDRLYNVAISFDLWNSTKNIQH